MKKLLLLLSLLAWGAYAQESTLKTPVITLKAPAAGGSGPMIQAALYQTTNLSWSLTAALAGGGEIDLGPGIYYVTNTLIIPNAGAMNLKIKGCGKVNTIIKYVGGTSDVGGGSNLFNVAVNSVTGPPGGSSLNITFEDVGFSHVNFNNYANLLRLSALNELDVENCGFFTEQVLTNGGTSLNYTPGVIATASGTIPIYTAGCNMVRVRNSSFWGTAYGVITSFNPDGSSGHTRIQNCIFDGIKTNLSLYLPWQEPISGYNVPRAAAVVVMSQDGILFGNQYDGCTIAEYTVGTLQTIAPVYESVTVNHVVDGVNAGVIEYIAPNSAMGSTITVDRKMAADGGLSTPTTGSIAGYGTQLATGKSFQVYSGGAQQFAITTTGSMEGNGSGVTNTVVTPFSGTSGNITLPAGTYFFPPNNTASNCVSFTSDASGGTRSPVTRTLTLRNFYVVLSTDPGVGKSFTFTIMTNGVASSIVATATHTTTANDTTHTVPIVAGVEVGVKLVVDAASTAAKVSWGFEGN